MNRSGGALVALLTACGANAPASDAPDLPPGWEAAERVDVVQFGAIGDARDANEQIEVRAAERQVLIAYVQAPFRIGQDVEAFAKESASAIDVLVQPVDMEPLVVNWGDGVYEIYVVVPTRNERVYDVTLYRRWDHLGGDTLVRVATAEVSTVPGGG